MEPADEPVNANEHKYSLFFKNDLILQKAGGQVDRT
jgi:hypothetical protein